MFPPGKVNVQNRRDHGEHEEESDDEKGEPTDLLGIAEQLECKHEKAGYPGEIEEPDASSGDPFENLLHLPDILEYPDDLHERLPVHRIPPLDVGIAHF